MAKVTREAPGRIPFLVKDPRGHADFYAALARHDAKGSANTMRSFQGGRPSMYTMTEAIQKVPTPALIICGDEDDACVEPSLFLKKHLPAAGLTFFPKSGHVLNLEEPALFNEMVERFVALTEAGAGRYAIRGRGWDNHRNETYAIQNSTVIASETKQSKNLSLETDLDCFVAEPVIGRRLARPVAPRNDRHSSISSRRHAPE